MTVRATILQPPTPPDSLGSTLNEETRDSASHRRLLGGAHKKPRCPDYPRQLVKPCRLPVPSHLPTTDALHAPRALPATPPGQAGPTSTTTESWSVAPQAAPRPWPSACPIRHQRRVVTAESSKYPPSSPTSNTSPRPTATSSASSAMRPSTGPSSSPASTTFAASVSITRGPRSPAAGGRVLRVGMLWRRTMTFALCPGSSRQCSMSWW